MKKGISTILMLMAVYVSHAQIEQRLDDVAREIEKTMKAENVPAISVGVLCAGETHFVNKGVFNRQEPNKVDEQSIYQIASLGKIMIGFIVHNLLIENKLHLDQPITDFLPPIFSPDRLKKLKTITVEGLLHHRSGLPQDAKGGYRRKDGEPYQYNYTEEDLYTDLQKLKIKSKKKYQYSNIGYALLAHIAAEVSKASYSKLLDEYVLKRYNLKNTTLTLNEVQNEMLVTPYRKDKRNIPTAPWEMGLLAPPSGLYSTVSDLSEMMSVQMEAYKNYEDQAILDPWVLTDNTAPKNKDMNVFYGYGFADWGHGILGHGGDMDGYASIYLISPKENFGIVLLTSSGENWVGPMVSRIKAIMVK